MNSPPAKPKLYHITHIDNLPGIITRKELLSDAQVIGQGITCSVVGMSKIKQRRLQSISVTCNSGTKVGDYVPFYFCPRSIMLYLLSMRNHPDITYLGGQDPILHLQFDLGDVVAWANSKQHMWAFSDRNAGSFLAQFYNQLSDLNKVDWSAVANTYFRDPVVKEGKQAEFLVHESVAWKLVEKIGVFESAIEQKVQQALSATSHKPLVKVERSWYY